MSRNFTLSTDVGCYNVTFGLTGTIPWVIVANRFTGKVSRDRAAVSMAVKLISQDLWPAYAQPLLDAGKVSDPQQERLF